MDLPTFFLSLTCLASTVESESRGEIFQGQVAVAEIILNRASGIPENVCAESTRPGQFAPPSKSPSQSAYQAAAKVLLLGGDKTKGATYFIAPKRLSGRKPSWLSKMKLTATIGNHEFYSPRSNVRQRSKTLSNGFES